MGWFYNLGTSKKLGLGFFSSIVITAIVGWAGWLGIGKLYEVQRYIANDTVPSLELLVDLKANAIETHGRILRIASADDLKTVESYKKKLGENNAKIEELIASYKKIAQDKEDEKLLASLDDSFTKRNALCTPIISAAEKSERAKALELVDGEYNKQFREVFCKDIDALTERNKSEANRESKEGVVAKAQAISLIMTATGIGVLCALSFAVLLSRLIGKSLTTLKDRLNSLTTLDAADLNHALQALENYDLTVSPETSTEPIPVAAKDDLSQMAETFNTLLETFASATEAFRNARASLAGIVGQLQNSATSVAGTSQQLAAAAHDTNSSATSIAQTMDHVGSAVAQSATNSQEIAKGTEQLASTANAAATAVEHLSKAIDAVRTGGEEQKTAVRETIENVKAGVEAAEKTAAGMKRIERQVALSSEAVHELGQKGQQIGEIVQTIEDIAQQTNLLALNAAIEAARAGDQGKGFAVVADEVRKLAERSATATQEIAALIGSVRTGVDEAVKAMESSAKEVSEGAQRSEEAGEKLAQINESAIAVGKVADDTLKAVLDMTREARQVESTIETAAAVSQESAASAEELNATAEEVAASTEQVAASIQEQTASIQQVSAAAQQLSSMSAELANIVQKFRIDSSVKGSSGKTRKAA